MKNKMQNVNFVVKIFVYFYNNRFTTFCFDAATTLVFYTILVTTREENIFKKCQMTSILNLGN